MKFEVIVLSKSGDFFLEEESQLEKGDKGVTLEQPYIMNEDENAQRVQAETVFIPFHGLENIQYGEFEQETVE